MIKKIFGIVLFFCFGISIALAQNKPVTQKREFRGVWVATVTNIDWPSRPGLNAEVQKQELIKILDQHQRSGINAIMLQVRPTADAFYAKSLEPWSKWLTGKQGVAPTSFYDPLEFALTEAHKRGMELHAWFNPYRAAWSLSEKEVSPDHITKTQPEWFFNYGGQKLFNPGLPEVRDYIVSVIMNVVKNYDIDGVHFDDYFYPYPVSGKSIPDTEAYKTYGSKFTKIADWRRHNVDTLIQTLTDSIHTAKKHVKFGISPFGIWKNKSQDTLGSATNGGSSYVELYADTRTWLQKGWIDYVNPQLYWQFQHRLAAFETLTDWWSNNTYGKHLYIGHGPYRAAENSSPAFKKGPEIPNQIRHIRQNARIQGSVFFSSQSLTKNLAGVQDSLRSTLYLYPALQPAMIWLDNVEPQSPMELTALMPVITSVQLSWKEPFKARDGETAYGYVLYRFNYGEAVNIEDGSKILNISFDKTKKSFTDNTVLRGTRYTYVVTAIDRLKNESAPSNALVAYIN